MKVPGTLEGLAKAIAEAGWGTPHALRFDSDSNLIEIVMRPTPAVVTPAVTPLIPARKGVSPLSIHGRPPSEA